MRSSMFIERMRALEVLLDLVLVARLACGRRTSGPGGRRGSLERRGLLVTSSSSTSMSSASARSSLGDLDDRSVVGDLVDGAPRLATRRRRASSASASSSAASVRVSSGSSSVGLRGSSTGRHRSVEEQQDELAEQRSRAPKMSAVMHDHARSSTMIVVVDDLVAGGPCDLAQLAADLARGTRRAGALSLGAARCRRGAVRFGRAVARRACPGVAACRLVSRFIAMAWASRRDGFGRCVEQGRRDSNPQPPVLETGALPIELLPSGGCRCGPAQDSTGRRAALQAADIERERARSAHASGGASGDGSGASEHDRSGGRAAAVAAPPMPPSVGDPAAASAASAPRRRSPASSSVARISASRPGAGSSTSVRRRCSARSSLRYWASSAWQRRQRSTWRRVGPVEPRPCRRPRPAAGRRRRHTAWAASSAVVVGAGSVAQLACGPGAAAPWPPTTEMPSSAAIVLVRQAVDVSQHHDAPAARRQLASAPGARSGSAADVGRRLGVGLGGGSIGVLERRRASSARGGGGRFDRGGSRAVGGDPVHPGGELGVARKRFRCPSRPADTPPAPRRVRPPRRP